VFVPYTYQTPDGIESQPSQIMDMLELKSLEDYAALEPDKWGIPTLGADSVALRRNSFGNFGMSEGKVPENSKFGLDLIVVPGMAFDRNMGRLGHGKGFYDYFFARCHRQSAQGQTKMPFLGMRPFSTSYPISLPRTVGLALNEQLLPIEEFVPADETDWTVDALVLGDGSVLQPERR
jgi:5-formyltetrahydrofolate cyclo-ligase